MNRPNNYQGLQPMEGVPAGKPMSKGKTLASVVGVGVAVALGFAIPMDESGRKVDASVDKNTNALVVKHISGKQYLKVYLDIVKVPTACDGLTRTPDGKPMKVGASFTEAQCAYMLELALVAHAERVMACSPGLALSSDPATEYRRQGPRFAAVSLGYNVGTAAYCGSTARRMFNAYNYDAGCNALLAWNKAGGRVVQGLVNRRKRENKVCLKGLSYAVSH